MKDPEFISDCLYRASNYLRAADDLVGAIHDLDSSHGSEWLEIRSAVSEAEWFLANALSDFREFGVLDEEVIQGIEATEEFLICLNEAFPQSTAGGRHPEVNFDESLLGSARDAAVHYYSEAIDSSIFDRNRDPVPADIVALFETYGWTVSKTLGRVGVALPESLMTNVEDPPINLYWMRAKALSEDAGYELERFLGKRVAIELYDVGGTAPSKYDHSAFAGVRGIVMRDVSGVIAGAFFDTGRHSGKAYSLSGRDLEDIDGTPGYGLKDYWAEHYLDPDDPVNVAAAQRTANEVVERYFQGMATGDDAMHLSSLSVERKLASLFTNLDNWRPFNRPPSFYSYLDEVEIIDIKPFDGELDEGQEEYEVEIDASVSDTSVLQNGPQTRFIILVEENGMLRVSGDGTGP